MAFQTEWIVEPYIISTTFTGRTSVHDMKMAMLEYLGAAQLEQNLYILMDFMQAENVPSKLLDMPILAQIINHGNIRWLVIAKEAADSSYMTQFLARDKVKTVRSREEALKFLIAMMRLEMSDDTSK